MAVFFHAGSVAARAEDLKITKYNDLDSAYFFVPVAVETCGAFGPSAHDFLQDLGWRVRKATSDDDSYHHLVQRVFVAIQRGNAASVLGSLTDPLRFY